MNKQSFRITQIGTVHNSINDSRNPDEIKQQVSSLIIDSKFIEGLFCLEKSMFIDVVFAFHNSLDYKLQLNTFSGNYKGVFASRSPNRPSSIGITRVKILEIEDNTITVKGLDALNNTPILDIKPVDLSNFDTERNNRYEIINSAPRRDIIKHIKNNDLEILLAKATQIHGHFCTGIALGLIAATFAMRKFSIKSDGLEDLLSIVETNNCFSDGIQFVTGCTFGNNSLIFKDFGKTAFTLTKRDGKGLRISTKASSREYIRNALPEFSEAYKTVVTNKNRTPKQIQEFKNLGRKKAYAVLKLDFEKIFTIKELNVEIPDYAPSRESFVCAKCGESVMKTREVEQGGKLYCLDCVKSNYNELTGYGINVK